MIIDKLRRQGRGEECHTQQEGGGIAVGRPQKKIAESCGKLRNIAEYCGKLRILVWEIAVRTQKIFGFSDNGQGKKALKNYKSKPYQNPAEKNYFTYLWSICGQWMFLAQIVAFKLHTLILKPF
jgi:hypothetical protein